jgi:hypothetical protein
MNLMMNPSFTAEIAAQRRQALIVAADRHRTRRWFGASKSAPHGGQAPHARRVLQFVASASPATADVAHDADVTTSATVNRESVATAKEFEHACGRVA